MGHTGGVYWRVQCSSNVLAGREFGIPISGTHAHSLVQAYGNDYEAFRAYAESNRDVAFLVDTYDTLRSGVPAAIKVANEFKDRINFLGVRIDSGDMAFISKRVRQQLDDAGYTSAKIYASNDLDENTIQKSEDARCQNRHLGESALVSLQLMISQRWVLCLSWYRLKTALVRCTIRSNCLIMQKKVSTPGKKQVWRITRRDDGKSEGDCSAGRRSD